MIISILWRSRATHLPGRRPTRLCCFALAVSINVDQHLILHHHHLQ